MPKDLSEAVKNMRLFSMEYIRDELELAVKLSDLDACREVMAKLIEHFGADLVQSVLDELTGKHDCPDD